MFQENMNQDMNQDMTMFKDAKKFTTKIDGDIHISTDCSTWAKVLINNLKLDDYLYSEQCLPPFELLLPNFGTREKKKKKHIEEPCESCGDELGLDRYIHRKKIICLPCMNHVKNCCSSCKQNYTLLYQEKNKLIPPIMFAYIDFQAHINGITTYCKNCYRIHVDDEYDKCLNCGSEGIEPNSLLCRECIIYG